MGRRPRGPLLLLGVFGLCAALACAAEDAAGANDFDIDDEAAAAAAEEIAAEAAAEEIPDQPPHILTNLPPADPDVFVDSVFRPFTSLSAVPQLVADKPVETLVGFANGAEANYVVWGVVGSLNAHTSFSTYVQNFTFANINATVKAGQEMSILYKFVPGKHLPSKDYTLAMHVFYDLTPEDHPDRKYSLGHSHTFINATVSLLETEGVIDNRPFYFFTLLFIGGIAGAIFGYAPLMKQMRKRSRSAAPRAGGAAPIETGTGTTGQLETNEWLAEHNRILRSSKVAGASSTAS